jgi:hypothetical protein
LHLGGKDLKEAVNFFKNSFTKVNKRPEKEIFVHLTFATDTKQTKKILDDIYELLIKSNLDESGLI